MRLKLRIANPLNLHSIPRPARDSMARASYRSHTALHLSLLQFSLRKSSQDFGRGSNQQLLHPLHKLYKKNL